MVGGDGGAFDACRDLFDALARAAFHVGPVGSGARMKLATNLVLGLNRAALAEGLAFARSIGLDPAQALEIVLRGAAASRVADAKGPRMLAGDFAPEARLSQHLKDVRLILAEAPDRSGDAALGSPTSACWRPRKPPATARSTTARSSAHSTRRTVSESDRP